MDAEQRYRTLVDFLLPYQEIWKNEIMLLYPEPLKHFKPEWIEAIESIYSTDTIVPLALLTDVAGIQNGELKDFFNRVIELITIPGIGPLPKMPVTDVTWTHIIPKKQQELTDLAPLVFQFFQDQHLERVVDIGGGQGHLAQLMAHHYNLDVTSVDGDGELQVRGDFRQKKKWPESKTFVKYHPLWITRQDNQLPNLLSPKTLSTGLHTCGDLALSHMEACLKQQASMINLPCCYHKLTERDCNLSQIAKLHPIPMNLFTLTLATGAHHKITNDSLRLRDQVKRFRYALHFLLHEQFGMNERITLGNCPQELYFGDFSTYAREQLGRIDLKLDWSDAQLNAFHADPARQKLIEQMLCAGVIRDAFGRMLELAILLDRILWLKEQGYEAQIVEVFAPSISPRNIALMAHPKGPAPL